MFPKLPVSSIVLEKDFDLTHEEITAKLKRHKSVDMFSTAHVVMSGGEPRLAYLLFGPHVNIVLRGREVSTFSLSRLLSKYSGEEFSDARTEEFMTSLGFTKDSPFRVGETLWSPLVLDHAGEMAKEAAENRYVPLNILASSLETPESTLIWMLCYLGLMHPDKVTGFSPVNDAVDRKLIKIGKLGSRPGELSVSKEIADKLRSYSRR